MKALLLLAAFSSCMIGWSWVALAMESHWQQVRGAIGRPGHTPTVLRILGAVGVLGSLGLCLRADHASIAALVWVLMMTAAALAVTLTLAWRPRLLAPLAAWMPTTPGLSRVFLKRTGNSPRPRRRAAPTNRTLESYRYPPPRHHTRP